MKETFLTFSMVLSKSALAHLMGERGLGTSNRTTCPVLSVGSGIGAGKWVGLVGVASPVWLSAPEVPETAKFCLHELLWLL